MVKDKVDEGRDYFYGPGEELAVVDVKWRIADAVEFQLRLKKWLLWNGN